MLKPVVSPEEWSLRYGLEIKTTECLHCKRQLLLNEPVASKKYRGFKTPEHGCPQEYDQYLLILTQSEEELFSLHS